MCVSQQLLTASADQTARLWDVLTGDCQQVLLGHSDEIFSCAFNYNADTIITGKDDFILSKFHIFNSGYLNVVV